MLRSIALASAILFSSLVNAERLQYAELNEDNYLLLNITLDKTNLVRAIDAYTANKKLLISAEPLLDALQLKYQIQESALLIWKDDQLTTYELARDQSSTLFWSGFDGYLLIDIDIIVEKFDVAVSYDSSILKAEIATSDYQFPTQVKAQQELERKKASRFQRRTAAAPTITIPDYYQLATVPHGLVAISASKNHLDDTRLVFNTQTSFDLLYHSANLTLTESDNSDLTTRLNLSRYKKAPDQRILGLIDKYSVGDVNGYSDSLTTQISSGLGFNIARFPSSFRDQNIRTSISETAPPGWDAELFLNGELLSITQVPDDGNLVFNDVETRFGSNQYQIKLYGPYGETDVRNKFLTVDRNALGKNQKAFSFYALDPNQRLLNDSGSGDGSFELSNIGFNYDYGVTDAWQVGLSIHSLESDSLNNEFITLKNALAFPGILFEHEFSANNQDGYAQISSLTGNGFGQDTFAIVYQSANDYESGRIRAAGRFWEQLSTSYVGRIGAWGYNLGFTGINDGDISDWRITNRVNRGFAGLNFSNVLNHRIFEDSVTKSESTSGSLLFAGRLNETFRISSSLNYKFDGDDFFDSVSTTLSWRQENDITHNLRADYRLIDADSQWRIGHNLSWYHENFRLTMAANYDELDRWTFNAGIRFYLGYDYRNNELIFSNRFSSQSASLDVHTYLDRNPNGWRDEFDYDLQGIKFSGHDSWRNLQTGDNGRLILPGVTPNTPFEFSADWGYGAGTLQKDYVVYTHPGAHIKVNMPFVLTSEFTGFVFRHDRAGDASPLRGAKLQLLTIDGASVLQTHSDADGYYEFTNIQPGQYQVIIDSNYLRDAGYTSDILGYRVSTPIYGGFVELDTLFLRRSLNDQDYGVEGIANFSITAENSDQIFWPDDEEKSHHYFNLTPSNKAIAQKTSAQPDKLTDSPIAREQLPEQLKQTDSGGIDAETRSVLPVTIPVRENLPDSPEQRDQLPQKLPDGANSRTPEQRSVMPIQMERGSQNDYPIPDVEGTWFIQYGIFSKLDSANRLRARLRSGTKIVEAFLKRKRIYRVQSQYFSNQTDAYTFAYSAIPANIEYLIKDNQANNQITEEQPLGYVIQLEASQNASLLVAQAEKYRAAGLIFLAEKKIDGVVWYCLITRRFTSKEQASTIKAGFDGSWIADADVFTTLRAL